MRRLLAALLLLIGLASPALAAGAEGILDFASDITVNADASLTVREKITVDVEHVMINHGIDRDFPTTYTDRTGQRVRVGFAVLDVKRDGKPEPYAVSSQGNGKRVRIGDKDVIIDTGTHVYDITYRTTRQLGFFKDYDELYWNVTGNGWDFAIDHASVVVRLPPGAAITQSSAYTGYQGDKGTDFKVTSGTGNEYRAETTRWLHNNEGFTVAVAWPKGFVTAPSEADKTRWWLQDNLGFFGLAATLLAALAYYLFAWTKVGRDPPKGAIIPLFKPPEGMDPASLRYVVKQHFDDRTFAAGVVGLAVKGGVKISEDAKGIYTLTRQDHPRNFMGAEQSLYSALPKSVELKQANHATVSGMKGPLKKVLGETYDNVAFLRNLPWFWGGAALSAVGLIVSALLLPIDQGAPALMLAGWSAIWWGVILSVGWGAVKGLISARGIFAKLGSLFSMMFLIPFVGAGIFAPGAMFVAGSSPGMYAVGGAAILLGIMAVLFYNLLSAPTIAGRKLLDQIDGFRMYMTTAEEKRLNMLNPPEKTPELFERYLPYAMALDCENEWNAKFAAVLAAAAAAGAAASSPSWYSGSHWGSGSFGSDLGSSLASSISSASTAPGGSSGSGGGGSSGGGGGGGGGGGW